MDNEDRVRIEKLINEAKELLSRDLRTWRPPLYKRIKWWDLAVGLIIIAGGLAVFLPLKYARFRQGFSGNLVSSAWQLIAGGAVAWVAFKRFTVERFNKVIPIAWDNPFREMDQIFGILYPMAIQDDAADLRTVMTHEVRQKLIRSVAQAHRKASLYGRFFEIEQITYIDRCCDAAEVLASIDTHLPDPVFMKIAVAAVLDLYVWSSLIRGYRPSERLVTPLNGAIQKWLHEAHKPS